MKKCRICEEEKELTEFHKNRLSPDGHISRCKECRNRIERDKREVKKYGLSDVIIPKTKFSDVFPDINQASFYCWVYRNTEYTSMKDVFGDELFQLVLRFTGREDRRKLRKYER